MSTAAAAAPPPPPREQTFLRVKRRRNENPPSTIRLELLGGWGTHRRPDENENKEGPSSNNNNDNNNNNHNTNGHAYPLRSSSTATLADSDGGAMSTSTSTEAATNVQQPRTAAAVWKRVEELQDGVLPHKRCRVVEAIFESDGRMSKRRKLTVLGQATREEPKKKIHAYKVLDPTSRLVDDSLTQVHAGDRSIADHYRFVTTDPRLATNSRNWLTYRNRGGNLLHACAHWNDVELAHDLLRQSLGDLTDALDGDGRTPYEAAQLCGHDSILELLEAFGADTTNFVYDMFVPEEIEVETMPTAEEQTEWNPLDKTPLNDTNNGSVEPTEPNHKKNNTTGPDMAMVDASRLLELQGGVGYWTEEGDLILEVEAHHISMGIASEFGQNESDEDYEGEDIDSNCEDYGGNDYPDEELEGAWEEEFLPFEPQIEDDGIDPYHHHGGPSAEEYDMW